MRRRPYALRLAAYLYGLTTFYALDPKYDEGEYRDYDVLTGRQLGHLLTGYRLHPDPEPLRPRRPLRDHVLCWPVNCSEIALWPRRARPDCPRCAGKGELWGEEDPYLSNGECLCKDALLTVPVPQWLRRLCHLRRYGRPWRVPAPKATPYPQRLRAFANGFRTFREPRELIEYDGDPWSYDPSNDLAEDSHSGRMLAHLLTGYRFSDVPVDAVPLRPLRHYRIRRWTQAPALVVVAKDGGHPSCRACGGRGYVLTHYLGDEYCEGGGYYENPDGCHCTEPILRIPVP